MNKNDIKKLLQNGERLTLEAKLAKTDVPMSVWMSYSAFANTMGGTILLCVSEDLKEKDAGKRFSITGVDDADKIRKDFWNIVNNSEKVMFRMIGFGENLDSGFPLIQKLMDSGLYYERTKEHLIVTKRVGEIPQYGSLVL